MQLYMTHELILLGDNKRERIVVMWTSGQDTTSDLFTKKLDKRMCTLYKHTVEKLLWILEMKRVDHVTGGPISMRIMNHLRCDPDNWAEFEAGTTECLASIQVSTNWYSTKQNAVETSTFGSEFIALKVGCEKYDDLRYKSYSMGFPDKEPTNVYCDNEAVIRDSSKYS